MKENLVTENLQHKLYNVLAGAIMRKELPPGKPMLTVQELCSQYQVSSTTVKAVLKRLQQEKLIRPRRSRPALVCLPPKSGRNMRIGVVVYKGSDRIQNEKIAYSNGPFGWMLYRAILLGAKHNRIACTLFYSLEDENIDSVDGLIAIGGDEIFYQQLVDCGKLFVNLMAGANARQPGALYLDRRESMLRSAFYFLSGGVKNFYVVGYQDVNMLCAHRQQGFDRVLVENGIASDRIVDLGCDDIGENGGRMVAGKILSAAPECPVGVLTRGDFIARGAVREFMLHGWIPKKDFFVIGITDLEEAARWEVPLTVQSCPYEALGTAAVELLKKNIENGKLNEPTMLESRLIIRKT